MMFKNLCLTALLLLGSSLLGSSEAATLQDAQSLLDKAQYLQASTTASSLNTEAGDLLAARALVNGYMQFQKGERVEQMQSAEKYARSALERRNSAEGHFWLGSAIGYILAEKGVGAVARAGEVRSHYEEALKLDPEYADATFGLAQWHLNVPSVLGGRLSEAERLFARAVELNPKRVSYRLYYAEALLKISGRNKKRATLQLEAGLKIVPTSDGMREIQDRIRQKLESLR